MSISDFKIILFILFWTSIAIQLFYLLFFYIRMARKPGSSLKSKKEPVSVIICARDEANNLRQFLPRILEQEYPDFEVVVVNDCSEDDTESVLDEFKIKYKHLVSTQIKKDAKFRHSKKLALTIGIKAAQNELLLLTDADCYPESHKWIEDMVKPFSDKTNFVLGYGGYQRRKGLLNTLIRFDTLFIAIQYLSFAMAGIPYMGVGRNLAYRRSLFFNSKGFARHSHLTSGDDDLFVNQNATGKNTRVIYNPTAHTRSIPAKTIGEWIKQKHRHLTTGPHYRSKHKLLLSLEPVTRYLMYGSAIVMLLIPIYWIAVAAGLAARTSIYLATIKLSMSRLKEKDLLLYSLVFDLVMPPINLVLLISGKFAAKKSKWT